MSKILAGIVIGGVIMYTYQHVTREPPSNDPLPVSAQNPEPEAMPAVERNDTRFHCDGRIHCSEMSSCEEATYFVQNCPGVKMDGDRDGLPCEDRCGH